MVTGLDLDLGSSPGWWAATVDTYCPSRMVEHPKSKSTKPGNQPPSPPCTYRVAIVDFTIIVRGKELVPIQSKTKLPMLVDLQQTYPPLFPTAVENMERNGRGRNINIRQNAIKATNFIITRYKAYRVGQKRFVLGCVIPPAGAVARSRNLGQTSLAYSVFVCKNIWT